MLRFSINSGLPYESNPTALAIQYIGEALNIPKLGKKGYVFPKTYAKRRAETYCRNNNGSASDSFLIEGEIDRLFPVIKEMASC